MKKLILLFILVFLTFNITKGKDDSLYVEINQDTLFVWNINVWENCTFSPVFIIVIAGKVIKITENDRAVDHTAFSGYRNYCIPITELSNNEYTIGIWIAYLAQFYPDTSVFKTSPVFHFILPGATDKERSVEGCILYGTFPNPFNPGTTISYSIPERNGVYLCQSKPGNRVIVKRKFC